MNVCILSGRVGADVKVKKVGEKTLASTRIGVYKSGSGEKTETQWITIEAWEYNAEKLMKAVKGDGITVRGKLNYSSVKKTDGTYTNFTSVVVDEVLYPVAKGNGSGSVGATPTVAVVDDNDPFSGD